LRFESNLPALKVNPAAGVVSSVSNNFLPTGVLVAEAPGNLKLSWAFLPGALTVTGVDVMASPGINRYIFKFNSYPGI
jgi:hypothetical protein